jgi:molecular chaperone DnaK
MKQEAQANAEGDRKAKEAVEKVNQADSLIFQTEKQLKDYGDKLSDSNKSAIGTALEGLKSAHKSQDIAAIDTALANLNNAWQAASAEIYAATGANAGGSASEPGAQSGGPQGGNAGGSTADANNVSDVEYEEVNDKK